MKRLMSMMLMALLTVSLAACGQKETQGTAKPEQSPAPEAKVSSLNVQKSDVRTTMATVEAVDLKTRIVTLKSMEGKPFKIHVGKEAVNLPQVKKGDKVEITYAQALEVRMAEPGEVRNEKEITVGRAKRGAKPRGVGMTETTITATIMELDKVNETATLKFADGALAIVKVQNPANLDKVKVGDTIAITYLEAIDIAVKGSKR